MGKITTTLQDVAEQAGVSKTTAAAILRNASGLRASTATRQHVLEVSRRLGYRRNAIATSLQTGRTHVIGVLLRYDLKSHSYARRSYALDLLVTVLHAATQAGLRIIPVPVTDSSVMADLVSTVTDRHFDGLILGAVYDEEFRRAVEAEGVPCVEINGIGPYVVRPDNQAGAAEAVAYLAQLGHRRIAYWSVESGSASKARRAGFYEMAERLGIETSLARDEGEMRALLSLPVTVRPTGIFAFNDYYACSALAVARDLGIAVPDELSIVGFDDKILAETAVPPLTTIDNPLEKIATAAVDMLLCRVRGEEPTRPQITVPVSLVVRGSTGAAPAALAPVSDQ